MRKAAETTHHHPVRGNVQDGPDAMAVVDGKVARPSASGQVAAHRRRLDHADVDVFANTTAPSIMIARRRADMVLKGVASLVLSIAGVAPPPWSAAKDLARSARCCFGGSALVRSWLHSGRQVARSAAAGKACSIWSPRGFAGELMRMVARRGAEPRTDRDQYAGQ